MLPMTVGAPHHRLVLVRHAKSAYPYGVPDHDRPLAGKGRRNAQAVGAWFVGEGPRPDLVICSDAQRARHTWEIVAAGILDPPPVRLEPRLAIVVAGCVALELFAWRSLARWHWSVPFSCWTMRSQASIREPRRRSWNRCFRRSRTQRFSWRRTGARRSCAWTGSWCSTKGGSSPAGRTRS